jgi:NADPH:quinone reductase-like Zn-dependent oxidoreductase
MPKRIRAQHLSKSAQVSAVLRRTTMKALVSQSYGPLEELTITELPAPVAGPGEILVRIEAASLNGADAKLPTGAIKDFAPVKHPFVPGIDASGVVETVGEGVTRFSPGDKVITSNGFASGAIAEYQVVKDTPSIAIRPGALDAAQGAALPLAAATSKTVLDAAGIKAGESVLVVGASGGLGSFAVQLAKQAGAKVLATGRNDEVAFLRGLGADEVIDYKNTNTAEETHKLVPGGVDVVLDLANAGPGLDGSAAAAKPGGRLVSVLGGAETFERGVTATYVQTKIPAGRLEELAQQAAEGKLRIEIGATYAFADAAQALVDFSSKHFPGKVVITL